MADLVIKWLRDTPGAVYREVDGTLAFVDISGFTSLTERLARAGAVGAEEMSDILSAVFTDLLEVAFRYGAWLVKWGGDAVLLLFEGEDHPALASRAAFEMRRALRQAGQVRATAGSASLRLSVGVHSGPVAFFLVGTQHRELVITGPAATEVALMEGAADAGEIVLSPAAAALVDPRVLGEAKGPGLLLRAAPVVKQRAWGREDVTGLDLAACLPRPIADYVLGGAREGEHRRVAVAFVEFSGTDKLLADSGPEATADALHELVSVTQEACSRSDVTFFETDVSVDGGKIMLVSGAPRSEGHPEQRLLRAARAVIEHGGPLSVRVGANAGRVFAGDFGHPDRRTYSVKGDAVNLAARVMGRAGPGQLFATTSLLDGPDSGFRVLPLPPFSVKGKSKPVTAVVVGPAQRPPQRRDADAPPLVGRQAELRRLRAALATARTGHGQVVEIEGPSGIGKSRLADELLTVAEGLTLLVTCDRYAAGTPYALIDAMLRELLGVPASAGPQTALAAVADAVEWQAAALRPWLPLLAAVVGADLPPTPEVAALAGEFVRARLELTAVELIGALLPGPAVIVIEDIQFIDDASASLLARLLADVAGRPWLIVFTSTEARQPQLTDAADVRLVLEPLGQQDATALLSWETRAAPLLPHQLAAIAERSTGNPLFARELVRVAVETDGTAAVLPESIEDVVVAQIDRLEPADRDALRAVAVAGMRVDPDLLAEVLGQPPSAGQWARLGAFVQPDEDGSLRFRHALVRDTAYEGLSFRRRRELHDGLGRALEHRTGRTPDAEAGLLSVHFYHAQNFAPAAHYAWIAGEQAAVVYANAEAASFFARALDAARRKRRPAPEEIAHIAEAYADVKYRLGEFAPAGHAYATARKLLRYDPIALARLRLKTAQVVVRTGGLSQALRWITSGRRILEGLPDLQARRLDARLLADTAMIRQWQGRNGDAQHACEAAIAVAESAGARDVLARALQLLDAADVARGRFDSEPWAERSLAIWEELGELGWQARALNQLGIRAYFEGRWADALAYYQRAAQTFDRVGDQWNAAIAACNVAEILSDQGHYAESDDVARPALRVLQATGALSETAFALSVLGRTAARAGRLAEARDLLDAAKAGYVRVGERGEELSTDVRIAECLVLAGENAAAETLADNLAAQVAGRSMAAEAAALDRLRGYLLAQRGQPGRAADAFEASLASARERSALYDQALSLDALIRLASHAGRTADHTQTAARDALFGRLGVVATAAFPLSAPEGVR